MSIHKEGDTEIRIFSVSQSLNKLIQIRENDASALKSVKFGGKISITCTRYWNDFSFDTVKEIELWSDGKRQDISINGCLFSYLIKGKEGSSNSRGDWHNLNLQGCWTNGDEFSFEFDVSANMDELVAIIYAMIILSETKDIKNPNNYGK